MGGRGTSSGMGMRQMNFEQELFRERMQKIKQETQNSIGVVGSGGGFSSPKVYKKCACCGEFTLSANSKMEACPNCGWIDDEYQNHHPDSVDGANSISLIEAKRKYFNS